MRNKEGYKRPLVIEKPIILLVEGRKDEIFFKKIVEFVNVDAYAQIIQYEGKDNLKNRLDLLLKTPGYNMVKTLVIVRDANDNPKSSFQSVQNILKQKQLATPSKPYEIAKGNPNTGIVILPDENESGDLEALCLKALKDNNQYIYTCAENYTECLKNNGINIKKLTKTLFYAFLSATEEPEITFYTFVKDPKLLNLNHQAFEKLLNFTKSLPETLRV